MLAGNNRDELWRGFFLVYLANGSENREPKVSLTSLLGRDTTDHVGAILDSLL
jgi:hypothetical protein